MAEVIPALSTASTPAPLRRLPGRSPSVRQQNDARATLWLGDTQIVQELARGYTLEVQRFALADLHAVTIRRTGRGLIYNAVLLVLLLPFGLQWVSVLNDGASLSGHPFFWGTLVFLGALLVVNVVRGPTCRTTVLTAFGPQVLPSLSRVRTARRALGSIAAHTAAVQGALRPDEAAEAVDRVRTQAGAAPVQAAPAAFQAYRY